MINNILTYKKFGYTDKELKNKSRKPIFVTCECCFHIRISNKSDYRKFCSNCKKRDKSKICNCRINKPTLKLLYIKKEFTSQKIAHIFNTHTVTIINKLKLFNIKTRNCKDASILKNKNKKLKDRNKCLDCNKRIRPYSKRCRTCFGKNNSGSNNVNFISGKPKCQNCGIKLKNYNSIKCRECTDKNKFGKNNPNYGKGMFREAHPNWKGGKKPIYNTIRDCNEYKEWRKEVFKRDNFTCQNCGDSKGGNLEAHHKKAFAIILFEFLKIYDQFSPLEDKETLLRLAIKYKPFWDIENGQTLCKKCHVQTDNYGGKTNLKNRKK